MVDASAQADIRGLDIDRMVRGFADEELILKPYLLNNKTSSREIRYFVKTAGFLDSPDTTGITASQIITSSKSLPVVAEPSWTRASAFVKAFKVESPWISNEDIADNDVDMWATAARDLARAVANQVDIRCYDVLADKVTSVPGDGGNVPTGGAVADGWDDTATGDPVTDFLTAQNSIRSYRYKPQNSVAYMHSDDYKNLVNWIINVKGSSMPALVDRLISGGVLMNFLKTDIVVSNNATTDYVVFFVPQVSASWKSFMPIKSYVIDEPGIAKKIRVVEEGEAILHDPNSVYVLSDTQV